ncbi:cholinesterase 2-like isoform X1 [Dermacentor albipictus]|uniref:cholinesterase 2-like isoform X1 n=1 Tax=Dermacentor albipictus TaxID=60249 RepID=UPI0031FC0FFC
MSRLQSQLTECLRSSCPEYKNGVFYWTGRSVCVALTVAALSLCGLLALLYRFVCLAGHEPAPLADSLGGTVKGIDHCEGFPGGSADGNVTEYLGVPYGRVGQSGRFAEAAFVEYRPGMPLRLGGVPACPQYPWSPVPRLPTVGTSDSDDCLYLNIWMPGRRATISSGGRCRARPVVVVLHGGRFQFGGGGTYPFYEGRRAAALWDAVVVVPAYRVGAFGFLNMLVPEAPGNVGLLDQALAIRWVHRYVHYFGGDNQRVTLLGQDAGATSIGYHLARNDTPPIRRAILMSGSPFAPQPANAGLRALLNGNALADVLGCGSRRDLPDTATRRRVVECLRKRSAFATVLAADELATSSDLVLFAPSANRDFPWKLAGPVLSEARLKQVDFLVGVARDEGTLHVSELMQAFSLAADQTLTPRRLLSVFLAFLEAYGIQDVDSVLRHYGFDEPSVLDETLGQLFLLELARPMGDFLIYCPTLFFLEKASSVGGRAFFYEFGYSPNYRTWPAWQGVPQFIDFMFATGLLAELDAIKPVSARDMVVARDFARIVAGFAGTGNPNVLPNMLWRRWEPSADGGLVLDYDVDSAYKQGPSFPEKANCDFWRRHFVLTN